MISVKKIGIFALTLALVPTVMSSVFAQDPFADLVDELLGEGSFEGTLNDDIDDSWGFDSNDDDDIEILQFDDNKLIFEMPVLEEDGEVIQQFSVTVMPVTQDNIDELFSDDDFYDNIDLYEAQTVSATISDGTMTIAVNVADTDERQYLTIYPLQGNERGRGIEDFRIDEDDNPSSTSDLTDQLADCLEDDCEDIVDQVSCVVDEDNYDATITWNNLGGDQLQIFMKEHDDNEYEIEDTVDVSDESFSTTLPRKTSFLFMLRPVDDDLRKEGTEVVILCKFSDDEFDAPPACVGDGCVGVTPTTGPESALLIIFGMTALGYFARRVAKK